MKNKLRVMQMIDSLSIGGAERVSINYANALSQNDECISFHCATRNEGMLKEFLLPEVNYFFMNKKSFLDKLAYIRLISFVNENKINIIHAHSSSFFTAIIVKLFTGVKIVWHDHYGREIQTRSVGALKIGSLFFSYVISVNNNLKVWSEKNLLIQKEKISYMPNYADLIFNDNVPDIPGKEGKRIVILANLRPQKDHLNILKAFKKVFEAGHSDWTLLLVGRDWNDVYSTRIKEFIINEELEKNAFVLGGRSDTAEILKCSDIGVLSSISEGLPIALLEYGLASLPVIVTDVGECRSVTQNGKVALLVPSMDEYALSVALLQLIENKELRQMLSEKFSNYIDENYSKKFVVKEIKKVYFSL